MTYLVRRPGPTLVGTKSYIVKRCFGLKLKVCFHDPNCDEEFDLKRNDSF